MLLLAVCIYNSIDPFKEKRSSCAEKENNMATLRLKPWLSKSCPSLVRIVTYQSKLLKA
jgi:hypothetical protein